MTRKMMTAAVLALALVGVAGANAASAALKDEVEIQERLITIGMAYEISEKCDSISARLLRGYNALRATETRASALGYSDEEIEAYTDDKVEKARLIVIAKGRLHDLGVVEGQAETYCTVGQAQIAAGTEIGRLLY